MPIPSRKVTDLGNGYEAALTTASDGFQLLTIQSKNNIIILDDASIKKLRAIFQAAEAEDIRRTELVPKILNE